MTFKEFLNLKKGDRIILKHWEFPSTLFAQIDIANSFGIQIRA